MAVHDVVLAAQSAIPAAHLTVPAAQGAAMYAHLASLAAHYAVLVAQLMVPAAHGAIRDAYLAVLDAHLVVLATRTAATAANVAVPDTSATATAAHITATASHIAAPATQAMVPATHATVHAVHAAVTATQSADATSQDAALGAATPAHATLNMATAAAGPSLLRFWFWLSQSMTAIADSQALVCSSVFWSWLIHAPLNGSIGELGCTCSNPSPLTAPLPPMDHCSFRFWSWPSQSMITITAPLALVCSSSLRSWLVNIPLNWSTTEDQ
jgi:hypothetical protein